MSKAKVCGVVYPVKSGVRTRAKDGKPSTFTPDPVRTCSLPVDHAGHHFVAWSYDGNEGSAQWSNKFRGTRKK